jgi:hypothetical protein
MSRPIAWSLLLAALLLDLVAAPESAYARKAKPAADASTSKDDKDDKDDDDDAAETHKARAKEFASGKKLYKEKTRGQVDKLTGQVSDLEKKMKAKGELPADDAPKKGKKRPSTQPVEPAVTKGKKKGATEKNDKSDKTEASSKSDK